MVLLYNFIIYLQTLTLKRRPKTLIIRHLRDKKINKYKNLFCDHLRVIWEAGGGGGGGGRWERERENSNSKTLFYKDCSSPHENRHDTVEVKTGRHLRGSNPGDRPPTLLLRSLGQTSPASAILVPAAAVMDCWLADATAWGEWRQRILQAEPWTSRYYYYNTQVLWPWAQRWQDGVRTWELWNHTNDGKRDGGMWNRWEHVKRNT